MFYLVDSQCRDQHKLSLSLTQLRVLAADIESLYIAKAGFYLVDSQCRDQHKLSLSLTQPHGLAAEIESIYIATTTWVSRRDREHIII